VQAVSFFLLQKKCLAYSIFCGLELDFLLYLSHEESFIDKQSNSLALVVFVPLTRQPNPVGLRPHPLTSISIGQGPTCYIGMGIPFLVNKVYLRTESYEELFRKT
jgi:hypothetical protein